MKIIQVPKFKVGAWYKTGCYTESLKYIQGVDVKCVEIDRRKRTAYFLVGKKKTKYDLIGEWAHADIIEDENHERGVARSEVAVRPWFGTPPLCDPYLSLKSHNFVSRIAVARKKVGLSQAQLSELLGIPKRTIENWESGVNVPKEYTENSILEKLAEMEKEMEKEKQG